MSVLNELPPLILAAIGGAGAAGAAFYFLCDHLAKFWASRSLETVKHHYATELAHLKAQTESELALYREKYLGMHREKIELYRAAIIPVIELWTEAYHKELTPEFVAAYDRRRLEIHAHLALFASQDVLDAYDDLLDHIYDSLDNGQLPEWSIFRTLGFHLLNRMRADIGMSAGDVAYKGRR